MNKKYTYVSLFSCAGVGCYGFKQNNFECVATNELIERRLNIQKYNNKCKYDSGYIRGDITQEDTKQLLFDEINMWKKKENMDGVDVVIATPPCQGMSVANHKKTNTEITRNSLVIEAINLIEAIDPKCFVFENVPAFMKTKCYDNGQQKTIGEAINEHLSSKYDYVCRVVNFKNYGAMSSRTRTLLIGVRKDLANYISPIELFPDYREETNLRDVIYDYKRLDKIGEINKNDIYHAFKIYPKHMRDWVHDLKEGESAFQNKDPLKRPHQVKNGEIVQNLSKNGDKYRRQIWDKVAPCVHTRNDIFASQNTIHPEDDRVFSIRELMDLMTIPKEFRWAEKGLKELNNLTQEEKAAFLKSNEVNIRQSIGEAVPTLVMGGIAEKIYKLLSTKNYTNRELKDIIKTNHLNDNKNLTKFINVNQDMSVSMLSRIIEMANGLQQETAAYYTEKATLTSIFDQLPTFLKKEEIRILEPSVGCGNFIPFIAKKYEMMKSVNIDVCDINEHTLKLLKILVDKMELPSNIHVKFICTDFLEFKIEQKYDLVIGNPPFLKLKKDKNLQTLQDKYNDIHGNNTAAFFLEKSCNISDNVVMIMPKGILSNSDYESCRSHLENYNIQTIIDFGEQGFKGVLIETICLFINTVNKPSKTRVISTTKCLDLELTQKKICDKKFPTWIIYRNEIFDRLAEKMKFDIFESFRDRQVTNKFLKDVGSVWVIKSRNISRDGKRLEHIEGYDSYIELEEAQSFKSATFYDRDDVYLTPNMTYYPRVIKKPKGTITNGSVAILMVKDNIVLNKKDLEFLSSKEFTEFYSIARNYSTRSLNIDKNSIFYFGKLC